MSPAARCKGVRESRPSTLGRKVRQPELIAPRAFLSWLFSPALPPPASQRRLFFGNPKTDIPFRVAHAKRIFRHRSDAEEASVP
jgi:hypothetical protein